MLRQCSRGASMQKRSPTLPHCSQSRLKQVPIKTIITIVFASNTVYFLIISQKASFRPMCVAIDDGDGYWLHMNTHTTAFSQHGPQPSMTARRSPTSTIPSPLTSAGVEPVLFHSATISRRSLTFVVPSPFTSESHPP